MFLAPLALAGLMSGPAGGTIDLDVDVTDAPKDVLRAHERIPVTPGRITLVYPKWIPGHHMPNGPIQQLVDLHFSCGGREIPWRRDDVDMYAFHVDVPSGQKTLDVSLADVAPTGTNCSPVSAWVSFNELLLYPANTASNNVTVHPRLKLPEGWDFATPLHTVGHDGDWTDLTTVSLTTLVDSTVLAGAHFKKQMLPTGDGPTHEIDMAGDDEDCIQMPQSAIDGFASLVAEARTLFGATHYREYHWLVPVSDTLRGRGLEHHECSEDGTGRTTFENPGGVSGLAGLLAHEYTHSWCGKFRRPAGLATANYQDPMKGELLYVYEGMTQFWGTVLPARAGLWSKQEFLDDLARTCAVEDTQSGRTWRNDQDTAVAAQISRNPGGGWAAEHRGQDYYAEGVLIWLEADATIKQLSGGKKSLDDFCKLFFGPPSTAPEIRPYTFDDLVAGLEKTQHNDWHTFLRSRLDATGEHAPLGGLSASGWKLVYTEVQGGGRGGRRGPGAPGGEYRYSLGVSIAADGTVGELVSRMAFDNAGIVPGQKIVGLNGKVWSVAVMDRALKSHKPFDVLVAVGDDLVTRHVDYADGPKFPHLVRDESKPDLLTDIIASHAKM